MSKKIGLGVIFYGNRDQLPANKRQFSDLQKNLKSFKLKKYGFSRSESKNLIKDFKKGVIKVVLKNSYGRGHENDIEKFLEANKIPYFGSGSAATFKGTNKSLSKNIFKKHRLPVAPGVTIDKTEWGLHKNSLIARIKKDIGFPCIIKDVAGTDSRGIIVCKSHNKLSLSVNKVFNNAQEVLVEKFIEKAVEVCCLVVGNSRPIAYPPVQMRNDGKIFTALQKDKGSLKPKIPALLPKNIIKRIQTISISAHKALGCKTFSRTDILVKNNSIFLLEVDIHPGFSSKSVTTLSAAHKGQSLDELFLQFYKNLKKK